MIAKSSVLISRTMAPSSVPGRRRSTIDRSGHWRCDVATKRQATTWRRPPGTPSTTSTTLHGVYVVGQGMPDKLMASFLVALRLEGQPRALAVFTRDDPRQTGR